MGLAVFNTNEISSARRCESSGLPQQSGVFQTPIGKFGKYADETPITRLTLYHIFAIFF